jgi:hypothetical protein
MKIDFKGDPSRIRWTKLVSYRCSYCGVAIDEDACPLRLFHREVGAVFCDDCVEDCFGIERKSAGGQP